MEHPSTPTPAKRARLVVQGPRPCIRCAYELAGLPLDALCPECAAPVRQSLKGDILLHRAPEHLARLGRGALLVELAMVANFFAMLVLFSAALTSPRVTEPADLALWLALTGSSCLGLCGWWLTSTPDPGWSEERGRDTTRLVLRWALATELTAMLLAGAFISPGVADLPRPIILLLVDTSIRLDAPASSAFWALAGLTLLAAGVRHAASMLLVHALALRMPDPVLSKSARTTLRLAGVVLLLGIPGTYLTSGTMLASFVPIFVLSLAGIAWFVFHIFVVERCRVRLGEIEAAARNAPPA